ncbi:MAG: hypothetical protein ACKOA8_15095 [Deltaproteobacteria bacterium]
MMDILQWGLNLTFIGCLVVVLIKMRTNYQPQSYLSFLARIDKLESRVNQTEEDLRKIQDSLEEKIRTLDAIIEQVNRLLKNSRAGLGSFPLTLEESELKEAIYFGAEKDYIPSVSELENTKLRLQKESSVDLKTILKGQLS